MNADQIAMITSLKKKRGNIKRRLTNFENLLDSITPEINIETLDLENRLKEKHLPLLQEFEKYQDELDSLTDGDEYEEKVNAEERASFENRYYLISGKAKTLIKNGTLIKPTISSITINSESESNRVSIDAPNSETHNSNQTEENSSQVHENTARDPQHRDYIQSENTIVKNRANRNLPDLKIPTFSGKHDTWLDFFDSFNSIIHSDNELPIIQKFHYLKGCVTGDAAKIIAALETTSENYKVAWDLLKGRYHNKKSLIDSHIKALFEMPSISKDFSTRTLFDTLQIHIRALRTLSVEMDHENAMIIYLIKGKLNTYTAEKWEEFTCDIKTPTLHNLLTFLERRSQFEETRAATRQNTNVQKFPNSINRFQPRQGSRFHQPFTGATLSTNSHVQNSQNSRQTFARSSCYICRGEHGVFACEKFLSLSPKARYDAAQKVSLCINCLRGTHHSKNCLAGGCKKCGKKHNSLLHISQSSSETDNDSNKHNQINTLNQPASNSASNYQLLIPSEVVLATAIVDVIDQDGKSHPCRVMLDGGSQPHVVTEKFVNKIGLKKMSVNIPLQSIDEVSTSVKYTTSATIKSRYNNQTCDLSLFIVTRISDTMPTLPINKNVFKIPQDLFLADPEFNCPAEVDMILGAQYFYHFLRPGRISVTGHSAVFQETELGWVVAGCFNNQTRPSAGKVFCNFTKFSDLSILWELDTTRAISPRSQEEIACELHYINTTKRNESGRYVIRLPFNENKLRIGKSRDIALKRFQFLETKLSRNPTLKTQYVECIKDYLNENHMTLLEDEESEERGYYLPHHAVLKKDSITTKTRVVFDASCNSSTGVSLNDTLMVGPTIQDDLFSTFTRFRTFLYALTADIAQMYRQVQLHEEDRVFHKILWRENPSEPIRVYTLNTVTFGTASAPFLAVRTLHQLAEDEGDKYPLAANILKRDFYVDDLLTGSNTFQEALALRDDLIELLRKGGFQLRKWSSNNPKLVKGFQDNTSDNYMVLNPTETIKTLGIFWNPKKDSIMYTVNLKNSITQPTKRLIFSQTAQIFDPLGLLGPVIVVAKLLIQNLWKAQIGWDERVPANLHETWIEYRNQLPLLNHIQFDRCIIVPNQIDLQLHGFCDASEKAYGACLYLRSTNNQGKHHTSLICSKSRVAPIKPVTLPKLELCAALLLANLYKSTSSALKLKISKLHFWSDSTITLHWINTEPHTLKTFVAHRVAEIQTHTKISHWKHVPTCDNPADLISRGQMPHDFLNINFWKHGPKWLCQDESTWPQTKLHIDEIPETRKNNGIITFKLTVANWNLLEKYSSLKTLKHVLAFCLRFIHNLRNKSKHTGQLSQTELEHSHLTIIKLTQQSTYSEEIHDLSNGKNVNSKSDLLSLNPFLDKGILKVGGRLENAKIPETQKHPIVLPRNHNITRLIIREEHLNKMHAGTQATLYGVREMYWPIDGRNVTRHIIRQCITCFKAKPRGVDYIMGNLPEYRLFSTRPFLHVGVDYCGPFFIKEKRHRNRNKEKTYVSIFVCFATKAVHLELVGDLTSEAFIGCLKRFFSRRGKSRTIHSDNGTNFVGASNELKKRHEFVQSMQCDPAVQRFLISEKVEWRFSPPRSPHFGGLWEAAVRSFKHHFMRTIGGKLLTYEQFQTILHEIEAILNSRPLTPLSPDPNDFLPLTPGHFLIGSTLTSFPQEDLRNIPACRLSCWQYAQQVRQHFWDRWHKEYLNHLTNRSKWKSPAKQDTFKIGALVVLREDNNPPMFWKLGRIVELHPGQDQVTRVVTVRTNTGVYKRNVRTLCPLPTASVEDN